MSKAKRKWLSMIAISLILAITACGGNGTGKSADNGNKDTSEKADSSNGSKSDAASVKLGVTWAGSQVRHDATLAALDLYASQNPNVTFEPSYMGFDTYFTKLATLSAAHNLPDIMQIDTGNLMDYALRGQLADLSDGIDTSNINDQLLFAGVVDGKQYGIPLGANSMTFMYNKTAFDKLGIEIPEQGFTWDELLAIAREVQPQLEKGKYFMMDLSMATGTTESDKYEIYQLAKGKGFIHTPDGKFNIDRDTYLEFNKLFSDLRKEGIVPPANVTAGHKQYDPQLDLFMNGTILVQREYSAAFPTFESVHPGQFTMSPVPSDSNPGGFLLPSQFFTVSEESAHLDEAKKFIDWFVNDKEAGQTLQLVRGVPVSKPVLDDLAPNLDTAAQAQIDIIDRVAMNANPFSSRPKGYGTWTDEWTRVSQAVAFDKLSPEEAFEELKRKWDEIIRQ